MSIEGEGRRVAKDLLFWSLPHKVRRGLLRVLSPAKSRELNAVRKEFLYNYDSLSCIFVHIPKTAGISIGSALFGKAPSWHLSIRAFSLMYPSQEFDRYFKFAFVRDPWERFRSAYRFLSQGGLEEADRRWRDENLRPRETLNAFVKRWLNPCSARSEIHFVPQVDFLRRVPWGPIAVDFVGRFENLAQDFGKVCNRLGVEACLGHMNRTGDTADMIDFRSAYDDEAREIVADVYRDDFLSFGYGS